MTDVNEKLKKIKLLLLDVDGVLTQGEIIYNDRGEETKIFNVKDGLGLKILMDGGVDVGVITGRLSKALSHRLKDLGISLIFEGVRDKGSALNDIMARSGVVSHEIAYIGDDLPDLLLLNKVGVSVAVADAHEFVRKCADMVTSAEGGKGAVREVCEKILIAKGCWEDLLKSFL